MTAYFIFYQIDAVLVNMRDFELTKFWTVVYIL